MVVSNCGAVNDSASVGTSWGIPSNSRLPMWSTGKAG
jgi:hypothetical protein